jgi:glycogen debranching enzyme
MLASIGGKACADYGRSSKLEWLETNGTGVSEVFDAEPPHRPGGCPAQAWSVSELLRVMTVDLAEPVRGRWRKPAEDAAASGIAR